MGKLKSNINCFLCFFVLIFASCEKKTKTSEDRRIKKYRFDTIPKVLKDTPSKSILETDKMLEGGYPILGYGTERSSDLLTRDENFKLFMNYLDELEKLKNKKSKNEELEVLEEVIMTVPVSPLNETKHKYRNLKNLYINIVVDTSQIFPVFLYNDTYFNDLSNKRRVIKQGYPLYVFNESDTIFNIEIIDGHLKKIQEAKDKNGVWRPIEYHQFAVFCGNSYGEAPLLPNYYALSGIYKYKGDFKTKLRVKLISQGMIYYSNEFEGYVNPKQFEILPKIDKDSTYQKVYFLNHY